MKYKASKDLLELLIKKSNGFISAEDFDSLIKSIEIEAKRYNFTSSSEANLIRIISAVYDGTSFLIGCSKYPHHIEIIIAIAANSNYLTDIVVRNPEFLYLVFDSLFLKQKAEEKVLSNEIDVRFSKYSTFSSKINFLRLLKRRITLKIGLNDILGNDSFQDTVNQISALANVLLDKLFLICYEEALAKYKIKKTPRSYCLCSLGKLGGNELNYSSDVDLIVFYDKNSTLGTGKKVEYFEILQEAVHNFIKHGSDLSSAGFLYRIDFRLRPDGRNAPLCRTLNDYLRYYETRGEDWERQMLIKLNLVSGSQKLYSQFTDYISGFVYQGSFSSSPLWEIKKMKTNIENRVVGKDNIKLFAGGIRDIEFSVQALQMVNGGKNKKVRTGTTLEALSLLNNAQLLSDKETKLLREAYIFYRKIEHYLQLMNNAQTHDIPEDEEIRLKIARYLNLNETKELHTKIEQYRKNVRKIFNSIVEVENDFVEYNTFDQIKFKNKSRAEKNRNYLKTGEGLISQKEFDANTIKLYTAIESYLYNYLLECSDPDKVLENFATTIRSTGFPSIWFREFNDPTLFKDFLDLCLYSQRAVELLIHKKSLAEIFITRQFNVKNISPQLPYMNVESVQFILAVQFGLKLIDHSTVSKYLKEYINLKITECAELFNIPTKYFIAGMGSFGVGELGFTSDLDIVFVTEKIDDQPLIQGTFQKILAKIQKELRGFEIDCRLRPEGKKSPLVWESDVYINYLKSRARVWEFQAMQKIDCICGDNKLYKSFITKAVNVIAKTQETTVKSEITSMLNSVHKSGITYGIPKQNLKKSPGALTDIDFALSYIILQDKKLLKDTIGKGTIDKITIIQKTDKKFNELNKFIDAFNFLKNLSFAIKNLFNSTSSIVPKEQEKIQLLAEYFGFKNQSELTKKITETFNSVITIRKKLMAN